MIHNGPYIAACAQKLGRELTKDEHIYALECLAHEAQEDVSKLRRTLEMVLASARPHPMENGQMYHAWEEARKVLDSQNVERTRGGEPSSKTNNDAARRRVARLVGLSSFLFVLGEPLQLLKSKFRAFWIGGLEIGIKRVIRGRQILYPSLALMILLGPCIKAASLNEPQMLGKDVAVNLLETPSLVKNPSEDVGGNIKFLSSIPPKMEPVSTKKPDQRGKNSKPFGVDEEREKINKRWHNGITALVTLIGGFFVGDWVAARQTAKKRDLKFSSNVERIRADDKH